MPLPLVGANVNDGIEGVAPLATVRGGAPGLAGWPASPSRKGCWPEIEGVAQSRGARPLSALRTSLGAVPVGWQPFPATFDGFVLPAGLAAGGRSRVTGLPVGWQPFPARFDGFVCRLGWPRAAGRA